MPREGLWQKQAPFGTQRMEARLDNIALIADGKHAIKGEGRTITDTLGMRPTRNQVYLDPSPTIGYLPLSSPALDPRILELCIHRNSTKRRLQQIYRCVCNEVKVGTCSATDRFKCC